MQTITDYIRSQLSDDLVAQEALQRGLLNLRAYGRSIRGAVEKARGEKVDLGTLAVALSRLEKRAAAEPGITVQNLQLHDLTVQAPLVDITFAKSAVSTKELETIARYLSKDSQDFITVTQGHREATIIVPARHEATIRRAVKTQPLYVRNDAVAVTVHFSTEYMTVPNVIYTLTASIAAHKVNLIEIISTLTELSFVVDRDDVETVTRTLQKYL